jgi:hypothetical protein
VIEKLKIRDDQTFLAIGPKFDFGKVLQVGRRFLKLLAGRSTLRFQQRPESIFEMNDGRVGGLDATAFELLSGLFQEIQTQAFDAADICVSLAFGPYLACWAPLGLSALCGPIGNCQTVYDENWSELDPTPTILIRGREPPHQPIGREATAFVSEILAAEGDDLDPVFLPDEQDADAIMIRFPHDAFGAGRDWIRICRYANCAADGVVGGLVS